VFSRFQDKDRSPAPRAGFSKLVPPRQGVRTVRHLYSVVVADSSDGLANTVDQRVRDELEKTLKPSRSLGALGTWA
jgi:hypothetical protein